MWTSVQTYAGYKGDERPITFSLGGKVLKIVEIVGHWYDPDHSIFKIHADNGGTYLLRYDMNGDAWELEEVRLPT